MHRLARIAAVAAALALVLAACSEPKDTGLPVSPTPEPLAANLVTVGDPIFTPNEITIAPGDEVTWDFKGTLPHNVRFDALKEGGKVVDSAPACSPTSGCNATGETFVHTFSTAGTFSYYCVIHGSPGGFPAGMTGRVVVKA